MIRRCESTDLTVVYAIINDAAMAYKGIISPDCWHEPYMPKEELQHEIEDGVEFWGCEAEDRLVGVMGIQDIGDVELIRHAYVQTGTAERESGRLCCASGLKALLPTRCQISAWSGTTIAY